MPAPEIIGTLAGNNVLLDRESQSLIIDTEQPIRFHVDHPYIQGTLLEKQARAALAVPAPAPCRYEGFIQTDSNDCCLRCGAADGQDCRDI